MDFILITKKLLETVIHNIYIYPVTKKLSDAKVERQVYKLALFGGGGGPYCVVT